MAIKTTKITKFEPLKRTLKYDAWAWIGLGFETLICKHALNRLFEYRLITRGAEIELILDYCKGKHNNVQWRPFSDWKKENPNRSIFWHD